MLRVFQSFHETEGVCPVNLTKYPHGTFVLKFSEKSFKKSLKFLSGNADIVGVRTKHLSARETKEFPEAEVQS